MTYTALSEYVVNNPNVRTLLVSPRLFLEICQKVIHKAGQVVTSTDASGEYILFHWIIIRPDVGYHRMSDEQEKELVER